MAASTCKNFGQVAVSSETYKVKQENDKLTKNKFTLRKGN
jgi:hypothetical protein